jgi:perosamine synthetase
MLCMDRPSLSFQHALTSLLNKTQHPPKWIAEHTGNAVLAYRGRTALALGCSLLGLKKEDEVLAPSYNCGMEVDVFLWLGHKVTLFKVTRNAQIDIADIKRRATPACRLVYITHYFGWDQQIEELAAWCKTRGLLLVEDCALSLFSKGSSGLLGKVGHLTIYSFSKTLPVPDGGAFALRNSDSVALNGLKPPPAGRVIQRTLRLLAPPFVKNAKSASHAQNHEPSAIAGERTHRHPIPSSYYFDAAEANWAISSVATGILSQIQPDEIVRRRRLNYEHLYQLIKPIRHVAPLFRDLPAGVCPLCMPILVEKRSLICQKLKSRGVVAGKWWSGYHRAFPWDDYPEACILKDSLLALPIHQNLESTQVEFIADTLRWAVG